jgi:hypothetical protein
MLLHESLQRGLFRAVALVMNADTTVRLEWLRTKRLLECLAQNKAPNLLNILISIFKIWEMPMALECQ